MSTLRDRRAHDAAQAATARAWARSESYDLAPRRRPLNGHHADCPNRLEGWMRRCPWCIAEARERGARAVNGIPVPATSALAPAGPGMHPDGPTVPCVAASEPTAPRQERACDAAGCWRPTDHHTGRCDRCRPEGPTT